MPKTIRNFESGDSRKTARQQENSPQQLVMRNDMMQNKERGYGRCTMHVEKKSRAEDREGYMARVELKISSNQIYQFQVKPKLYLRISTVLLVASLNTFLKHF
ncbi:hypothetical protein L596_028683 [Steinernema carpocapsae]|uniref:Uncharacterized protein n=1 Tax=Steinernema carpocapsae TaxID=34508 RepID=A0A4U5LZ44_STECR|nr:hypothetical protein L596_028683 [Steinernema carpocapsae]